MKKTSYFAAGFLIFLCTYAPQLTSAQGIMTTWVGNGTAGYTGDGGPADTAEINNPYGVCFDPAGNFFIADQSNFAIRRVDASTNMISTLAGNASDGYTGDYGPATAASIGYVMGICNDASGNLFFSEYDNHVVREVNAATGIIKTIAGNGTAGNTGDGGAATAAALSAPEGVCVFGSALYITDYVSNVVRMVNLTSGIITTVVGTGIAGFTGDGGPGIAAELNGPSCITTNSSGDLFIADETNFVIRKVSAITGSIATIAGTAGSEGYSGDDSAATLAKIGFIDGICIDQFGNLYIDDLSCSSRKINLGSGIISTMAGSGTVSGYSGDGGSATSELLNWPAGLCIDPTTGNIIIADQVNNRIRRATQPGYFDPLSTPTTSPESPISVFPNPSNGIFSIKIPAADLFAEADIYNLTGQRVYTTLLQNNETAITLNMPSGTYLLTIITPAGQSHSMEITISR